MKTCLILRGLPGCGKNTFIEKLYYNLDSKGYYDVSLGVRVSSAKRGVAVSADDYWGDEYKFDPQLIGEAHASCLRKFTNLVVNENADLVIVNNTNIASWEIAPYYSLASAFGYQVEILRFQVPTEECVLRRSTGVKVVPAQTIGAMAEALRREVLPAHWRQAIVQSSSSNHF